jgi:hypothetical protein
MFGPNAARVRSGCKIPTSDGGPNVRGAKMTANATTRYHLKLNKAVARVIEHSTADPGEVGRIQEKIDELTQWERVLSNRPESLVLRSAISEATVGAFLLISGLYRPAFVSLRLFLEMSLAMVHFSSNRLDLAEWTQGRRDVNWSELIDSGVGVLSRRYADAFFPDLRETVSTYNSIGGKAYRELSEYVHGNRQTWVNTPESIEFSATLQTQWASQFDAATGVVMYAMALRFLKELGPAEVAPLSATIGVSLGHIQAIQEYLRSGRI